MPAQNPRHLRPTLINIDDIFSFYAKTHSEVYCLQIGANDGKYDDPIHHYILNYKWKSILVEPLRDVFENQLTKTYAGIDHVILENCAIHNTPGERTIYKLSFTDQKWAMGLTSFNKSNIEHHIQTGYVERQAAKNGVNLPPNHKDYIAEEKVPVTPPQTLLEKHHFPNLNVVAIDTEGVDYEALKTIDFKKNHPDLILYESMHLEDHDFIASQELLKEQDYDLFWQKGNTLAVSKKVQIPWVKLQLFRFKAFLMKI